MEPAMTAYLIANVTVTDPEAFATYGAQVPAVIARFGGRYLVRGGKVEIKEGEPGLKRVVVVEFPSMQAAQDFYHSVDYAPLIELRGSATVGSLALVEGYGG
jgi:uncharacterized protein (DUF1330 family)